MTEENPPEEIKAVVHEAARLPKIDETGLIEKVFKDSENDYLTVLAIARRARQILEDYQEYADQLENEKATAIALREFLGKEFEYHTGGKKAVGGK